MLRSVFGKVLWDHRTGVWWWALGLGALAAITVAFYPSVRDQPGFSELVESLPPQLLAAFGVEDASELITPVGLVNSRLYASVGSILAIVFAVSIGTQAIAGEEERGTMDLMLAQPVVRTRIVIEGFVAMTVLVAVLATSLLVVLAITSPAYGLDLSVNGMIAANVGMALLALVYGTLALAIGGLTGKRRLTLGIVTALVATAFFVNGFATLVDVLQPFQAVSPFHWFLGPDPLANGFDGPSLAKMTITIVMLVAVAVWGFNRRDVAS